MNIHEKKHLINLTGVKAMCYEVVYLTKWFKDVKYCGYFNTLACALDYVDYLQHKLPNGRNIVFKITG